MCLDFQNQLHGSKLLACLQITLQRGDRLTVGKLQILDVGILGVLDDDAMDVVVLVYHHGVRKNKAMQRIAKKNASFPMLVTLSEMIISNRELQPLNADSANMTNQLILLRTKQKDAEVIMQILLSSKAP